MLNERQVAVWSLLVGLIALSGGLGPAHVEAKTVKV